MSFEETKRDDIAEVVLVLLTEISMKAVRADSNGSNTPLLPYTGRLIPGSILHMRKMFKNNKQQNPATILA